MSEVGLLDELGRGGRRFGGRTREQLHRRFRYCRAKLRALTGHVASQLAPRVDGRITHMWFIRVAFSPPNMTLRAVTAFCNDFGLTEARVISHDYVARVRDAFAEVIKRLNKQLVSQAARVAPGLPLFMSHVHDEAAMRIRSYQQARRFCLGHFFSAGPFPGRFLSGRPEGACVCDG
jgi:hypothetical protein